MTKMETRKMYYTTCDELRKSVIEALETIAEAEEAAWLGLFHTGVDTEEMISFESIHALTKTIMEEYGF